MPGPRRPFRTDRRRHRGFTLIELLITCAVAVILLKLAIPSFMDQVRKARRSDATDAAVAVLQAQERYRANNPSYAGTLAAIGVGGSTSYYTLALSNVTATSYTFAATATAGTTQASDSGCTTLTVAVTNGSAAYTPTTCWRR